MSQVVALKRRPPKAQCPICRRATLPEFRPFCSKRCKDEDMRKWLEGGYRIPTQEAPDGDGEGT
jgi:endogenous inhibitor of DNA gyrase (YacG/DUF329 family)